MIPNRLYIENFACYEFAFIDMTIFNTAIIVGKLGDNDMYSNGVGKSTIFNAIEYVLYNKTVVNMNKVIRDDTNMCKITLDFTIDDQEYRVSRSRTKSGASDLSLMMRTGSEGSYHDYNNRPISSKEMWKDIDSRRKSDTAEDLANLIKLNYTSFRSTVHFVQNDFTGLTTASPTDRKAIFKNALNLSLYSQLEKFAKDEFSSISKDIDKTAILLSNYSNIEENIKNGQELLKISNSSFEDKNKTLKSLSNEIKLLDNDILKLKEELSDSLSKKSALSAKCNDLKRAKSKLESEVSVAKDKKSAQAKSAKAVLVEIDNLILYNKGKDFSKIEVLENALTELKQNQSNLMAALSMEKSKLEDLLIPFPDDNVCKHCRQELLQEHKDICKKQLAADIAACKSKIDSINKEIKSISENITNTSGSLKKLKSEQDIYNKNILLIEAKNNEVKDKKALYNEFTAIYNKSLEDLAAVSIEIESVEKELNSLSLDKSNEIKNKIDDISQKKDTLSNVASACLLEINEISNSIAVITHDLENNKKDLVKKEDLNRKLDKLSESVKLYPSVIQAFSSTGIPNFIIQGVLDDLQIETNKLLDKLKPGLQMQFSIEKTTSKKEVADTLDILYSINGKERQYEQLSGGMKLAATFSLKIGLSVILQRILGVEFKFLLLDEVDKSLDKASVNAFADIIKMFNDEYKILIISHSDQLKDKFSHAILVQQNLNMVSNAKVAQLW